MARKKSEKEYLESFKKIHKDSYEYDKFPEIFNQKTKVNVHCKKHKIWFSINICNLMNGHGCPKCGKENMVKTKGSHNQEKYKTIIEKNYKDVFDLSEIDYKNCKYDKEYVYVTCKKCGKRQSKTIADLSKNRAGCLCDKKERMGWYLDQIKEDQKSKILEFSNNVFGDRLSFPDLIYENIETKIKIHCNIDNYDFYVKPSNFLYKFQSCPICSAKKRMSSFARATMYFLEDNNIDYYPEYIIENDDYLKNKPYDFFLKEFNLLIEVDGEQHRRPAFGRTEEDIKKQQEIDLEKVKRGNKHGFLVLRLNTEEDFLAILKDYLKNLRSSTTIPIGSTLK